MSIDESSIEYQPYLSMSTPVLVQVVQVLGVVDQNDEQQELLCGR